MIESPQHPERAVNTVLSNVNILLFEEDMFHIICFILHETKYATLCALLHLYSYQNSFLKKWSIIDINLHWLQVSNIMIQYLYCKMITVSFINIHHIHSYQNSWFIFGDLYNLKDPVIFDPPKVWIIFKNIN